jgi:hypothetical protein
MLLNKLLPIKGGKSPLYNEKNPSYLIIFFNAYIAEPLI